MTYKNSVVLPELTVTPKRTYVHNPYDNTNIFGNGGDEESPTWLVDMTNVGMGAEKDPRYYVDRTMFPIGEVTVTPTLLDRARMAYKNEVMASNDATLNAGLGRAQNQHLADKALEGAKAHAAWEEDNPGLATLGYAAGAVPFAVAAAPAWVPAMDWAAGTAAGQGVTSLLGNPYFNAGLTAMGAADAGQKLKNGEYGKSLTEDAMTALELMPLGYQLTKGADKVYSLGKQALQTAYDNGTFYDKYTTLGGRFGNWGDTWLDKAWGTTARRFGLPDKARIPGDAMRKLREDVHVENGIADLTGGKGYFGNPHTNITLDRNVVAHKSGWDGADAYIFPTKDFLNQTFPASLKSIEPSDMFANGTKVTEPVNKVTVVSGDVNTLDRARSLGMNTLSSPKLRRMYQQEADVPFGKSPKRISHWRDYAAEQQRLQSQRGLPTLADFRLLEEQTGMKAGVAPIEEKANALNTLYGMANLNPFNMSWDELSGYTYTYPNGRVVDDISKANKEIELIERMPYGNVFYDPATWAEYNWKEANGL